MTIDTAKVMKWLSIFMAVVGAVSLGTVNLPLGIPASWGPYITSWSITLMGIWTIVKPFIPADIIGPGASIPTNTPQKPAP
jgi:hypothetical protein